MPSTLHPGDEVLVLVDQCPRVGLNAPEKGAPPMRLAGWRDLTVELRRFNS